jgi:hypothetical protein
MHRQVLREEKAVTERHEEKAKNGSSGIESCQPLIAHAMES